MHAIYLSISFSLTDDDDDDDADKVKSKSQYAIFGTAPSFISPQVQTFSLSLCSWSPSLFSPNLFMNSDRRQKDKDSELIGCKHSTNSIHS